MYIPLTSNKVVVLCFLAQNGRSLDLSNLSLVRALAHLPTPPSPSSPLSLMYRWKIIAVKFLEDNALPTCRGPMVRYIYSSSSNYISCGVKHMQEKHQFDIEGVEAVVLMILAGIHRTTVNVYSYIRQPRVQQSLYNDFLCSRIWFSNKKTNTKQQKHGWNRIFFSGRVYTATSK